MGLPSKKQMNKHKRGAKKALETLDNLEAQDQKQAGDDESASAKMAIEMPLEQAALGPIPLAAEEKEEPITEEIKAPKTGSPKEQELSESDTQSQEINKSPTPPKSSKPDKTESEPMNQTEKSMEEDSSEVEIERFVEEDEEDTLRDKYLTFAIGKENYGIEVRYVTEIIVIHRITIVPDTPQYIKGVINLRGKVIPVLDIRERFGLELREYDERTCIIVVNVDDVSVGLIVDTVREVVDIPANQIDPPPKSHSGIKTRYIAGLGKIGKDVKILLDIQSVLYSDADILKRNGEYAEST